MAMNVPYAVERRPSYENFAAICPSCRRWSTYNRRSDLPATRQISYQKVQCLNAECAEFFNINFDLVNPPHEMLILDCYELLEAKHYMNCILTLAQAHEVFFSLYLRVELVYKPCGFDPSRDIDVFNKLQDALARRVEKLTFTPMRALFLQQILVPSKPTSPVAAEVAIAALPKSPVEPDDSEFAALADAELGTLLTRLKASKIHELRNKVVHKQAYRPTRGEAEAALEETKATLFGLTSILQLVDDPPSYFQECG
ncbi:MAG TPA: hypothetical protein VF017_08045 [Thermoanaerobaculia bacterium]|nr:hypothetical protein [Thermoanaerobaculia bacterium]